MRSSLIFALAALYAASIASFGQSAGAVLTAQQLEEGLKAARDYLSHVADLEEEMMSQASAEKSKANHLFALFKPASPQAVAQSKVAAVETYARQYLADKYGVKAEEIQFASSSDGEDRQQITCNFNYPYRTFDGTCNNLNFPRFGQAGTIFQHVYSQNGFYDNGVSTIRRSITGNFLPSPRLVSRTVATSGSVSDVRASLMTMQWGQFLDHDLTLTPTATLSNGGSIGCCSGMLTGGNLASPAHPECLPISIPPGDAKFGTATCMNFVRSAFGLNLDGTTPFTRQQINANTHWIDGSQVYGSNGSVAFSLRNTGPGRGLLRTSISSTGRPLLPLTNTCCPGDPTNSCAAASSCFLAGDGRVTEQPLLTMMHTLWVREHNRVANQLANLMPGNTDEFYYQEARRIVIAELQHITYTEYLPLIVGQANAQRVMTGAPFNANTNPAVFNEFAAAAYRMGHSQIRSFIGLVGSDGRSSPNSYFLSDSFNSGARLLDATFVDNALRGLTQTPVQTVDRNFADDVTSQLFKTASGTGLDLVALNIQRGRDHGLIPYTRAMAAVMGTSVLTPSFDALAPATPPDVIAAFKSVYQAVDDIDLFIGGVTEVPLQGALVGPLFANIISLQFALSRATDRFFYTNQNLPVSFTPGQLSEIQKVSLARIICDNSDGTVTSIQRNAFLLPDGINNPIVACSNIPGINFPNYVASGPVGK